MGVLCEMLANTSETEVMLIISATFRAVEDVETYRTFEVFTNWKLKAVRFEASIHCKLRRHFSTKREVAFRFLLLIYLSTIYGES